MTSEIEQVPEQWQYLGRREAVGGKLAAYWQMADGERTLFNAKRPPSVVGGIYEVIVYRAPDGLSIDASPKFVRAPSEDDRELARLEAEDRAAVTADAIRKAEAKAHRESLERFGQLTLAQLRDNYARQSGLRRAALLGQVLRYIGAA